MPIATPAAAQRHLLAALAGPILLASLGISVSTVALPTLAEALSADLRQVQWVVLAYLLALTVSIVSAGRLGDLFGSRRVLVSALALFSLASAACVAAPGLGWLVAGRVAQGLAAAALMALPMSLAKGLVAPQRLGSAMGLLGTVSAVGTALGPSLGGGLIEWLGWRAVFGLLSIAGLGVWVVAMRGIPLDRRPVASASRMDWAGSLWLGLALLGLALLATGGRQAVEIPAGLLSGATAIALAVFVGVERRANHPLLPLAVFGSRPLVCALTLNLLVSAVMLSTLVIGPFYLRYGLGLSALATGLVMAAGPVAAALSGLPAGRLTDRFGPRRTLTAGLMLACVGLAGFAALPALLGATGYALALVLTTPGFQLFLSANNTATMADAADAQRGMVSGLLGLSRNLGFMAGASLMPAGFAALLGQADVASAAPSAIGAAFRLAFLGAAALLALGLTWTLTANAPAAGPVRQPPPA